MFQFRGRMLAVPRSVDFLFSAVSARLYFGIFCSFHKTNKMMTMMMMTMMKLESPECIRVEVRP